MHFFDVDSNRDGMSQSKNGPITRVRKIKRDARQIEVRAQLRLSKSVIAKSDDSGICANISAKNVSCRHMRNGKTHAVPLKAETIPLLDLLGGQQLFEFGTSFDWLRKIDSPNMNFGGSQRNRLGIFHHGYLTCPRINQEKSPFIVRRDRIARTTPKLVEHSQQSRIKLLTLIAKSLRDPPVSSAVRPDPK